MDYYNHSIPTCLATEQAGSAGSVCLYPLNKRDANESWVGSDAAAYDFWRDTTPAVDTFGHYSMATFMRRARELTQPYANASRGAAPPRKPLFLYFAEQTLHVPIELPPDPRALENCTGVVGGDGAVNRTVLHRFIWFLFLKYLAESCLRYHSCLGWFLFLKNMTRCRCCARWRHPSTPPSGS